MAHKFVIRQRGNGEYASYFEYNGEKIFWTEGYASKAAALNAIRSIQKNGPDAPIEEEMQVQAQPATH